jgi:hypothetical protein
VKAYISLATGASWFAVAIILRRTLWSFFWRGGTRSPDPEVIATISLVVLQLINFGWILPTLFGIWLMWAEK